MTTSPELLEGQNPALRDANDGPDPIDADHDRDVEGPEGEPDASPDVDEAIETDANAYSQFKWYGGDGEELSADQASHCRSVLTKHGIYEEYSIGKGSSYSDYLRDPPNARGGSVYYQGKSHTVPEDVKTLPQLQFIPGSMSCNRAAKAIMGLDWATSELTTSTQILNSSDEDKSTGSLKDGLSEQRMAEIRQKGAEAATYVESELKEGRPVLVGITYRVRTINEGVTDHFMVAVGIDAEDYYVINDPANGQQKRYWNNSDGLIEGRASFRGAQKEALITQTRGQGPMPDEIETPTEIKHGPAAPTGGDTSGFDVNAAVRYNKGRGYSKAEWEQIQRGIGLTGGDVDGVPGAGTARAVFEYQQKHNDLSNDGKVGPGSKRHILDALERGEQPTQTDQPEQPQTDAPASDEPQTPLVTPPPANDEQPESFDVESAVTYNKGRGYTRDTWRKIQRAVGLTGNDVDGRPGRGTAAAIFAYQQQHDELSNDGKVGPGSLRHIMDSLQTDAPSNSGGQAPEPGLDDGIEDPFTVNRGQITFDTEGMEGGRWHSRDLECPGAWSGVTIGRGYDLKERSPEEIERHMSNAGIDPSYIQRLKPASGLKGDAAKRFCRENPDIEITPEQQKNLFYVSYDHKRLYVQDCLRRWSGISLDNVEQLMEDMIMDLFFRGDMTRSKWNTHGIARIVTSADYSALLGLLRNRSLWGNVDTNRYTKRIQYMQSRMNG